MATTYYTDLQKLYVAYFNRPADTAGLAYWETVVEAAKGSTAAVSATFAASAEYKAAFAGMSSADIVNTVYMNLFGRAAEADGKAYWAGLMDAGKITVDGVVTAIAKGALGSDMTAYNNKVTAASAFTAALGTTNAYSGDVANAAAKAFMASITTDASLSAAIAPFTLGATVASVNTAGTPFALDTGLATLTAANAAHTSFLAYADGDNNVKTTLANDAAVTKMVTDAVTAIDTIVPGYAAAPSAGQKSALLVGAQASEAAKLADAQATVSADNAAIAKVAGLSTAISALSTAKAAATAAVSADAAAGTDVALKIAAYNVLNKTAVTVDLTAGSKTEYTDTSAAPVITTDSHGNLVLATGVTETTNPGVTALLASLSTLESADANVTATATAQTSAQTAVNHLDLDATATADLKAVAAGMTIVKLAANTLPTDAQVTAEATALHTATVTAQTIYAQTGASADQTAATNASNAEIAFNALVSKFNADATTTPLEVKLGQDTAVVTADNKVISDLAKALTALDTANGYNAQLTAVNAQVTAAQTAFTSHGLSLPVSLDANTAPIATAGGDIYVAGTHNATIALFGLQGNDSLYIGNQYTLGTDVTKGNDSALEAFIVKTSTGTDIVLEQKAFASNESATLSTNPDMVTIHLTGVDSTHVQLSHGIITIV